MRLAELRAAGVTAATVSRMERAGEVIRLVRGVYQSWTMWCIVRRAWLMLPGLSHISSCLMPSTHDIYRSVIE